MSSLSALLLDDALKLMTTLTNSAIHQTLRQFAPLSAPELSWIVNTDKPSREDPLKQHNRQDLSLGCLKATCQAQSRLIMQLAIVVAGESAMSDISQGSVTTPMTGGGILSVIVTTHFMLIPSVKEFWKSVNIWWSYWHIKILCHFLAHPVYREQPLCFLLTFLLCSLATYHSRPTLFTSRIWTEFKTVYFIWLRC